MPLFQKTHSISHQKISQIVQQHWGLKLGKIIKASQNHIFEATLADTKFAVRVTPDPEHKHEQRVQDQLRFIEFLAQNKLKHVCGPVKCKQQKDGPYVRIDQLIICVFEWAQGQPVDFFKLTWMKDIPLIRAWGRYFANLHALSKQFSVKHPQIAHRIQNWNQIHEGVMSTVKLHEQDQKDVDNPKYYGVIHGDLNTSNCYYHKEEDYLSVYDSDQVQRGFYEWDLAQTIFGVAMLEEAGLPISGKPVPEADHKQFMKILVKSYEEISGQGSVNLARLQRMVRLKRQFYLRFCKRAIEEGDIPKDMEPFIQFIAKSLDKKQ